MNQLHTKIVFIMWYSACIYDYKIKASTPQSDSWPIITRTSRSILPPDLLTQAQNTKLSAFKPTADDLKILYQNYPNGSVLFANNNDLAIKFNTLVQAITKNPDSIEFLRKIQISYLNQLYAYLMKIYTNFTLTNFQTTNSTGTTDTNITTYLTLEKQYDFNKKSLIMNHFINLIQAQLTGFITACIPTMKADLAVAFGQMFIQNDYGIDLKTFTEKQMDAQQTAQLNVLELYIDFFQTYTNYLNKIDATGINQYYSIAQSIQNYLTSNTNKNSMNPAMFFYDIESMRSIQFIPFVASSIDKNTKNVPWAASIVNAAEKNITMNGHAIAYFKDALGKTTQNQAAAKSLYLLTEVGQNLFEEELLQQPEWLNNQQGCVKILSACLGNSSALIGMGILDQTLETVIAKATKNQKNESKQSTTQTTNTRKKK